MEIVQSQSYILVCQVTEDPYGSGFVLWIQNNGAGESEGCVADQIIVGTM